MNNSVRILLFSFFLLSVKNGQAQKNTIGVGLELGNSISPTSLWGGQAVYNLSQKLQVAAGVGFGEASSFKLKAECKYFPFREKNISPVVSFSYNYLLPNRKDYGEGLNDKMNFKYSSAHFLNARGGLNFNISKLSQKEMDNQLDAYFLVGYSKRISDYTITPADAVSYDRPKFDLIQKQLFTSDLSFNIGIIICINRKNAE